MHSKARGLRLRGGSGTIKCAYLHSVAEPPAPEQKEAHVPFLSVLYIVMSVWLSVYGFNAFALILLYLKHRGDRVSCPPLSDFPDVTVQLPLYNERYVVSRAIDALTHLDWPRDRLQIQVLDDSSDETTAIARHCVRRYQRQGVDISLFHRPRRTGYKAGALNEATQAARGTFIAIFDADFVPPANFLQRTIPHLVADEDLGFVQARWGHLNDQFSLLTLAQAVALDGHFAIEHAARDGAGLLLSFNGTGGVWRRQCITECGGWDAQMLTEDVDLSYRAQLAGWKGRSLAEVVAPAELPAQLAAFKQQQFRWAKGNVGCFIKLAAKLARAPLPLFTRLQGWIHLSYYLAHPLMLIVLLITLPLLWHGLLDRWALVCLSLATLGPPLLYVLSQHALYGNWRERLKALPVLICLGMGLALSNTVAVVEALLGVKSAFQRTPKFQIEGERGGWQSSAYKLPAGNLVWAELLLALYALLTVFAALSRGNIGAVPFLLLYVFGFGYVSLSGLTQARSRGPKPGHRPRSNRQSQRAGMRSSPDP